jgi:molybdate transport system substrate-binding protein
VQQVSELMLVDGVDVVGVLPDEIQDDLIFSGGVFANAVHADLAIGLIRELADPRHASLYREKGLQPIHT